MEICMKSLSGQGRKSAMALFIIAVRFYGGGLGAWLRRPGEECPTEDLRGKAYFYFLGRGTKIRPHEDFRVTSKPD